MKALLLILLSVIACRTLPRVGAANDASIVSFQMTPSSVSEGDTVTVLAEFTGASAEVSGIGEVTTGVPVTFVAARTGPDPLEEKTFVLLVHAESGDVQQSQKLIIHLAPVTPAITTVDAAARGSADISARIAPVLGLHYQWAITGGSFVSSSTSAAVVWTADVGSSATLSCTAFNALGVASAPATRTIALFGSQTFAGVTGAPGYANTDREHALFARPQGLALAADGSIYVSDAYSDDFVNCAIRRVAPDGTVSTFSGADPSVPEASRNIGKSGSATTARYRFPRTLAFLPDGSLVVADDRRSGALAAGDDGVTVRTLSPSGTSSPTLLTGTDGGHINAFKLASDQTGALYMLGCEHDLVFGGCPNGTRAAVYKRAAGQSAWVKQGGNFFNVSPSLPTAAMAVSSDGSAIYVGETGSLPGRRAIQIIQNGVVTLFAGQQGTQTSSQTDGPVLEATFGEVVALALDAKGRLYVADLDRDGSPFTLVIRRISNGVVTTLPYRPFVDDVFDLLPLPDGDVLIADSFSVERMSFP